MSDNKTLVDASATSNLHLEQQEREEFETTVTSLWPEMPHVHFIAKNEDGSYFNETIEAQWQAWRLARRHC
jgi:hypothetical protein